MSLHVEVKEHDKAQAASRAIGDTYITHMHTYTHFKRNLIILKQVNFKFLSIHWFPVGDWCTVGN